MITLLTEGEYQIPDDYTVVRSGNRLTVRPSHKNVLGEDDPRCRDCVHRVMGYTKNSGYYKTHVCLMQPVCKDKIKGVVRYKAAGEYGKACSSFARRKEAEE